MSSRTPSPIFKQTLLACALQAALPMLAGSALLASGAAFAQTADPTKTTELAEIVVTTSADASAEGLSKPYAGGQVARGGRIGILGTQDNMNTPFNVTSYTNELIQNQQAHSVADVLRNDPSVRVARGFGNFQESYFIRGFLLGSDEVAYNGLYSLLPRQYVAAELFERVEVLRGASAFIAGAAPNGGGIGGSINLLPKRAPNTPLTQVNISAGSDSQWRVGADIARRFGEDGNTGIRVNAVRADGGTGVDRENAKLSVLAIGVDWKSRDTRISADIGHQDHQLNQSRTNVTLGTVAFVPAAPNSSSNWAQNWSYSDERDTFGTLRAEHDINENWTAWGAFGARDSTERNSLANITVNNATTGAATTYRADNYREDTVKSGEVGLRGKLQTGSISHTLVAAASTYRIDSKNAYAWSPRTPASSLLQTNLYNPVQVARPATNGSTGGVLNNPLTTTSKTLNSVALGDTLGLMEEKVLVTLGARYQQLDTSGYNYNSGARTQHYDESRVSPMAGLVWKTSDKVSLYANYIESLAEGPVAPNDGTVSNPGQIFDPYVSKQKEVGIKYDAGKIGGALAFFTTKKPSGNNSGGVYTVSGEDKHQGAEFTVYGQAMRSLKILGGVTWLDAKQERTLNGVNDGKKVIGVPDIQANAGLEWDVAGLQGLSFDTQIVYTGNSYANASNTLRVPSWTRLDLGTRYVTEINNKVVTLRARVNNVTDRDYWASVGGYPGNGYLVLGTPRTFSLTASIDF